MINVNQRFKHRMTFRCYPTQLQKLELAQVFGACRYIYNWGLRLRTDAYHRNEKVGYHESSSKLTELKRRDDHSWLREISCVPIQQALRNLQGAFSNFFSKKSRYPSFKRKYGEQSAEYTRSGFRLRDKCLTIAKLGKLEVEWCREFESVPSTVTAIKDNCGDYYVSLIVEEEKASLPKTGKIVGIDLGINRLATLSDGKKIRNQRHSNKRKKLLARAQRVHARRKKGSKRRERARIRVAKIHHKIARCRNDHLQKVTTNIVRDYDRICVEDLNVLGMSKNHAIARSVADTAFGSIIRMLEYKCTWYGKELVKINRWFPSSKRCNACGYILPKLGLGIAKWQCPECQAHHDRDENAAINILAEGHSVTAQGGFVRPKRASARRRKILRTANHLGSCALH